MSSIEPRLSGEIAGLIDTTQARTIVVKGQSHSPTWNCWDAATDTPHDSSLFDTLYDYFLSGGGRIGQFDKSYARWTNNTGSGSFIIYTMGSCGGASQTFSSSWTSTTNWSSFKKSGSTC